MLGGFDWFVQVSLGYTCIYIYCIAYIYIYNIQTHPLLNFYFYQKDEKFFSEIWAAESLTLRETNMTPDKIGHPKRKVIFQPSIFRGELLVSGRGPPPKTARGKILHGVYPFQVATPRKSFFFVGGQILRRKNCRNLKHWGFFMSCFFDFKRGCSSLGFHSFFSKKLSCWNRME